MLSIPNVILKKCSRYEMLPIQSVLYEMLPRQNVTIRKCTIQNVTDPKKRFLKTLNLQTWVKKSLFSEVLGQNVTENKVLSFRFPGLFSLK